MFTTPNVVNGATYLCVSLSFFSFVLQQYNSMISSVVQASAQPTPSSVGPSFPGAPASTSGPTSSSAPGASFTNPTYASAGSAQASSSSSSARYPIRGAGIHNAEGPMEGSTNGIMSALTRSNMSSSSMGTSQRGVTFAPTTDSIAPSLVFSSRPPKVDEKTLEFLSNEMNVSAIYMHELHRQRVGTVPIVTTHGQYQDIPSSRHSRRFSPLFGGPNLGAGGSGAFGVHSSGRGSSGSFGGQIAGVGAYGGQSSGTTGGFDRPGSATNFSNFSGATEMQPARRLQPLVPRSDEDNDEDSPPPREFNFGASEGMGSTPGGMLQELPHRGPTNVMPSRTQSSRSAVTHMRIPEEVEDRGQATSSGEFAIETDKLLPPFS